jgi:hypothetical protein
MYIYIYLYIYINIYIYGVCQDINRRDSICLVPSGSVSSLVTPEATSLSGQDLAHTCLRRHTQKRHSYNVFANSRPGW